MKSIEHAGRVYPCPLSERFRRHTADERERMDEAGDLVYPVLLYRDATLGLDGCLLDGEGRLETAVRTGAGVEFRHLGEMTTEEAYSRAVALNDARRHDDPESLRKRRAERVARVAELRGEGKSTRAIADAVGVSQKQVRSDIAAAGEEGYSPEPGRVVGRDGKTYPAKPRVVATDADEEALAREIGLVVPDDPPPLNGTLPKPAHDGSRRHDNSLANRKGGSKPVDPDHPFADELKKFTALAAAITTKLRALPRGHPVIEALVDFGTRVHLDLGNQEPRRLPFLDFSSDVIEGLESKPGAVTFVALRTVRRILLKYGPMKRYTEGQAVRDFLKDNDMEDVE